MAAKGGGILGKLVQRIESQTGAAKAGKSDGGTTLVVGGKANTISIEVNETFKDGYVTLPPSLAEVLLPSPSIYVNNIH